MNICRSSLEGKVCLWARINSSQTLYCVKFSWTLEMAVSEDLKSASIMFGALGNPVRLRILLMLMDSTKPLHITAVASNLKMDYGGVYRHVEVLREAGLIQVYDVGRSRVLSTLNSELIKDFITKAKSLTHKR
jgi:DNA-binding transcriptional ArsR family regulator